MNRAAIRQAISHGTTRFMLTGGLVALLAGCSSSDPASPNYDPTLTAVGATFARSEPLTPAPFVANGARRGGDFPTFAEMPRGATAQISDVEREIIDAELDLLRARQTNDRVAASRYAERLAELQAIARNHGREAEAAIAQ